MFSSKYLVYVLYVQVQCLKQINILESGLWGDLDTGGRALGHLRKIAILLVFTGILLFAAEKTAVAEGLLSINFNTE